MFNPHYVQDLAKTQKSVFIPGVFYSVPWTTPSAQRSTYQTGAADFPVGTTWVFVYFSQPRPHSSSLNHKLQHPSPPPPIAPHHPSSPLTHNTHAISNSRPLLDILIVTSRRHPIPWSISPFATAPQRASLHQPR